MNPVTAFGLAAAIVQVVDVSFKALSTCREIYKDGSLVDNRKIEEVTESLTETINRLDASRIRAPDETTGAARFVSDASTRCSATAEKLLAELKKLRLEQGDGRRQALAKSLRSMYKRTFLKEMQGDLERHQGVLNTRILVGVDHNVIQQMKDFKGLNGSVRELASALSHGQNAIAQLVADQSIATREHIDRRFDETARAERTLRVQQHFKDSLFFPEIYARQENIHEAHEGTCKWIFESKDYEGKTDETPWPSFTEWLENGHEPYWLNGKPGSGKSTLMRYIVDRCRNDRKGKDRESLSNILIVSFFFWEQGNILQKSLMGLLRSILFQITNQHPDLISSLMDQGHISFDERSSQYQQHAWTEQRLRSVLEAMLGLLLPTLKIHIFIDALDEFVGEEEDLMKLVRLLSSYAHIRLCVSSRPEQIFRQGFIRSPQIKLQDLNLRDIRKAANDRLYTLLADQYPMALETVKRLVEDVAYKSQGVFLWLDLMAKRLKKGARDADTLDELWETLDQTPDTIYGMYEHMLGKLENFRKLDTLKYFGSILRSQEAVPPLTLLDLALAEGGLWEDNSIRSVRSFLPSKLMDQCGKMETRILARCAGLVEISNYHTETLGGVLSRPRGRTTPWWPVQLQDILETEDPACHLRKVGFIHKTVGEYLRTRHAEILDDEHFDMSITISFLQGRIGLLWLVPIIMAQNHRRNVVVSMGPHSWQMMLLLIKLDAAQNMESLKQHDNVALVMRDCIYECINDVNIALNGVAAPASQPWKKSYSNEHRDTELPFEDPIGLAAYSGCANIVHYEIQIHECSNDRANYLLICSLVGLGRWLNSRLSNFIPQLSIIREVLRCSSRLHKTTCIKELWGLADEVLITPWAAFIVYARQITIRLSSSHYENSSKHLSLVRDSMNDIAKLFVMRGADINCHFPSSASIRFRHMRLRVTMQETPLSCISMGYSRATRMNEGTDQLMSLGDMLRSCGGTEDGRNLYIQVAFPEQIEPKFRHLRNNSWYQLPQQESHVVYELLGLGWRSQRRELAREVEISTESSTWQYWNYLTANESVRMDVPAPIQKGFTHLLANLGDQDIVENPPWLSQSHFHASSTAQSLQDRIDGNTSCLISSDSTIYTAPSSPIHNE